MFLTINALCRHRANAELLVDNLELLEMAVDCMAGRQHLLQEHLLARKRLLLIYLHLEERVRPAQHDLIADLSPESLCCEGTVEGFFSSSARKSDTESERPCVLKSRERADSSSSPRSEDETLARVSADATTDPTHSSGAMDLQRQHQGHQHRQNLGSTVSEPISQRGSGAKGLSSRGLRHSSWSCYEERKVLSGATSSSLCQCTSRRGGRTFGERTIQAANCSRTSRAIATTSCQTVLGLPPASDSASRARASADSESGELDRHLTSRCGCRAPASRRAQRSAASLEDCVGPPGASGLGLPCLFNFPPPACAMDAATVDFAFPSLPSSLQWSTDAPIPHTAQGVGPLITLPPCLETNY
eukprot:763355-Hanusia_phi.AAC.2